MSEFKRTHYFRLKNGVEIRITMPESLWQERIVPLVVENRNPKEIEVAYREVILEAMGIPVVGFVTD